MYKFYSFLVISCISSFLVYNSTSNKEIEIDNTYNNEVVNIIEEKQIKEEIIEEKTEIININNEVKQEVEKELMIIEIPKINLTGKIYNINNKLNDIDKNIIIMKESDMPNKEGGILIIGGHSGYGKYAYFKNLNKLEKDDEIIIYYQNNKYIYKVKNIYLDYKDGSISINNDNKKNKLFLYTCNPNDKNNYLVIDCERV